MHERLIEVLPAGKENAVSTNDLAAALFMSSRELRRVVRAARLAGCPILSSEAGYWLSDNDTDTKAFISKMQRAADERRRTADAMIATLGAR